MKRLMKVLLAAGVATTAVTALASPAFATDGSLTYGQDCDNVYVTIVSHYSEGPIHIRIDAPVNAGMDIPPLGSHTFPFGWNGATTYSVIVTSSNGHLNGEQPGHEFHHTFTKDKDCTTPTTPAPTTPPTTTCEQAIPQRTDCGGPTTTINPCVTAPQPGQPGYDPCGDCSTPAMCPVTTLPPETTTTTAPPAVSIVQQTPPPPRAPTKLPPTGNGMIIFWVALGLLAVGTAFRIAHRIERS